METRHDTAGHRRLLQVCSAVAALALLAAACSGSEGNGSTSPTTPTSAVPIQTTTTLPATAAPLATTTSTAAETESRRLEFRQVAEDTDEYRYDIAYPILLDGDEPDAAANAVLLAWVDAAIAELQSAASALDAKATLTVEIAPELLNDSVLSLSGVSTRFVDVAAGTVSRRHGWIIDLGTGAAIGAQDLFLDGDLAPLAQAAQLHLIETLGEDRLAGPDGLLPVPANYDAVWLTSAGIGIGFDEGQVTAPDAGVPSVLVPFTEVEVFLIKAGVLAPLTAADTLPEL